MNSFLRFFMSRDGIVAVGTLVLLTMVMKMNTENASVNFIARTGNLAVFLYILWRTAGKAAVKALSGRREKIVADLEELERKKLAAARHLAELENNLADIETKRAAILDEAKKQAEAVKTALIAKAEADAKAIRERAAKQADSQTEAQISALRAEFADKLSIEIERMIRANVSDEQHAMLIEQSLKKVVL